MIEKIVKVYNASEQVPREKKVIVLGWGEHHGMSLVLWDARKKSFRMWPCVAMKAYVDHWCRPSALGYDRDYSTHFLLKGK